jgi:hypothetical protein
MTFVVNGDYDPKTNIATLEYVGKPTNRYEIDLAFESQMEIWGQRNCKVYVITDVTKAEQGNYPLMAHLVGKLKVPRKKYAIISVIVANSIPSKFSAKLYEVISGQKLIVVENMEEALRVVKKEQEKRGVFVPLDNVLTAGK